MLTPHIRTSCTEDGNHSWALIDETGREVRCFEGYESAEGAEEDGQQALREHIEHWMPSELQLFVNELTGSGPVEVPTRQVHRTIKLHPATSVQVDALAAQTGKSRNEIMNRMIAIGLQSVRSALPPDVAESFFDTPTDEV